ncbi:hypothetical protein YPPY03_0302, partial [Yersinia pestis PY-03]
MWLWGD